MTVYKNFRLVRGAAVAFRRGVACWAGHVDRLPRDRAYDVLEVNPLDYDRAVARVGG